MDTQAQFVALLHAQACLMLCSGLVMLIAHYTSRRQKANDGGFWYAVSMLSGSLGLVLHASHEALPLSITVILANALFYGHLALLTYAVALVTQQTLRSLYWTGAETAVLLTLQAWFTWVHPSQDVRILMGTFGIPMLLIPAIVLLLRTRDEVIWPATRLLAVALIVFNVGQWMRGFRELTSHHVTTSASWGGTVFIAVEALCFFWVDMLHLSAQLESQAMTDPLTGLMNRRAMETFAMRELARCHRQHAAIAALMIDLDGFKQVNDRYGHSMGDEALLRIACVIRESVRTVDLAARMGGDEFLVLLPDASELAVDMVTARLRDAIAQLRVPVRAGESLTLSATIGQAHSMRGDTTLQDLIQHSDTHLYAQKQADRASQGIEVASPQMAADTAAYADS